MDLLILPQKAALADWKKSHKVLMMMIAAGLMWAGAAKKFEQLKVALES